MGAVYAIRILTACAFLWLPDDSGKRATWPVYEQCARFAEFLRHNHGQDAECLMIPRGE